MYQERLKQISGKIGGRKEIFFVLTRKSHKREIYFRNTDKAIKFIEKKMISTLLKKTAYFLIKKGLLQPFLKKATLSSKFGDVIFVANRIKGFDLQQKSVISFPLSENGRESFIKFLKLRERAGEFAPEITDKNLQFPYYKEELLEQYTGDLSIPARRLKEFNKKTGLIHGDLAIEHILKKGDSCVFTDWEDIRKGHIEEDLSKIKKLKK